MPTKRETFRQLATGTLLYVAVMGLFDDYTSILNIRSHSTLILASLVMQLLTFGTLQFKRVVVARVRGHSESIVPLVLAIWAIMFFSKFVFLRVLDVTFGSSVEFSGFIGLALVVAVTVVVDRILELLDRRLAAAETAVVT